ncbi:hypothetical protein [Duffyella gerundensis]
MNRIVKMLFVVATVSTLSGCIVDRGWDHHHGGHHHGGHHRGW